MSALLPERLQKLDYWITERERMRLRHAAGKKPYTTDPVLAKWRFCNVRRMDDHVSQWLMKHWYVGERAKPSNVMGAATLARYTNLPDTLVELLDVPWGDWETLKNRLWQRAVIRGEKTFDPAYKITAGGCYETRKKYELVVDIAAEVQERRIRAPQMSMCAVATALCRIKNIKSFMAGQIVADVRHVVPGGREDWTDRETWAPMGPGSGRGVAWLLGHEDWDRNNAVSEHEFMWQLSAVIEHVKSAHPRIWRDRKLEAHDVQNCLCELSKMARGKGKQRYTPRREVLA